MPRSISKQAKDFHGLTSLQDKLAFDVLDAGMSITPNMLLVNEPILISNGANSDIRYNFFYPRWAYDEYRSMLARQPRPGTGIILICGILSLRRNSPTVPSTSRRPAKPYWQTGSPPPCKEHVNRFMKQKIIFFTRFIHPAGCLFDRPDQVLEQPAEVNSPVPLPSQPAATPVTEAITQAVNRLAQPPQRRSGYPNGRIRFRGMPGSRCQRCHGDQRPGPGHLRVWTVPGHGPDPLFHHRRLPERLLLFPVGHLTSQVSSAWAMSIPIFSRPSIITRDRSPARAWPSKGGFNAPP